MYNISANTIFTGKTIINLPTCHSTNEYASQLLSEVKVMEGTLIITPNQTAGKGQRNSVWEAEPGQNLTFSLIFNPSFLPIDKQFYLNIISSMAVRDTLEHFLMTAVKVKWPNDIYLLNNKISGILIQNSIKGSVINNSIIGVGINVNQTQFNDKKAISMKIYHKTSFSLEEVLNFFLEKMEAYYLILRALKFEALEKNYLNNLFRFDERNHFKANKVVIEGKIKGIDELGRLIIESEGKIAAFNFKEVEFLD